MEREQITDIVERVLTRVRTGDVPAPREGGAPAKPHGVFSTVDQAIDAATTAHKILVEVPLEKRREIIANIRRSAAMARGLKPYHVGELGFLTTAAVSKRKISIGLAMPP